MCEKYDETDFHRNRPYIMSKIATSIKLSRELGKVIDPATADMYYDRDNMGNTMLHYGKPYSKRCIPAWSAGVLLDMLPMSVDDRYALRLTKWYDSEKGQLRYECSYTCDDDLMCIHYADEETAVEAIGRLVLWYAQESDNNALAHLMGDPVAEVDNLIDSLTL